MLNVILYRKGSQPKNIHSPDWRIYQRILRKIYRTQIVPFMFRWIDASCFIFNFSHGHTRTYPFYLRRKYLASEKTCSHQAATAIVNWIKRSIEDFDPLLWSEQPGEWIESHGLVHYATGTASLEKNCILTTACDGQKSGFLLLCIDPVSGWNVCDSTARQLWRAYSSASDRVPGSHRCLLDLW